MLEPNDLDPKELPWRVDAKTGDVVRADGGLVAEVFPEDARAIVASVNAYYVLRGFAQQIAELPEHDDGDYGWLVRAARKALDATR